MAKANKKTVTGKKARIDSIAPRAVDPNQVEVRVGGRTVATLLRHRADELGLTEGAAWTPALAARVDAAAADAGCDADAAAACAGARGTPTDCDADAVAAAKAAIGAAAAHGQMQAVLPRAIADAASKPHFAAGRDEKQPRIGQYQLEGEAFGMHIQQQIGKILIKRQR